MRFWRQKSQVIFSVGVATDAKGGNLSRRRDESVVGLFFGRRHAYVGVKACHPMRSMKGSPVASTGDSLREKMNLCAL
jgi:hypothetical protein